MAKKTFDLGTSLADILGSVPGSDTGREQITYIEIANLDPDAENFYSMEGLDELAANIELVGLQQPLRVRENPDMPGRYLIVSGHRRRAAIWTLYEEDPERWGSVPCIIEPAAASAQLQQLRLIYANAGSRKMSSADLSRQAEQVETLLYELQEQGYEFPGRMRDHVAEACRVSKTKLATLKVIREKLIPEWKRLWESGTINETCAYKLAQQPEETQMVIHSATDPEHLTEWRVDGYARTVKKLLHRDCQVSKPGECLYARTLINIEFGPGYHGCSSYRCCKECPNLITCKDSCPNVIDVKSAKKAEKKAARAKEIKAEKARSAQLVDITRTIWTRFGELRREKGLSAKEITEARGDSFFPQYHGEEWQSQMEGPDAKITEHTPVPWTTSMQADDVEKLIKTADAFGVSCDYLLGRTDEKQPAPAEDTDIPLRFRSGNEPPEERCLCWCVFDCGGVRITSSAVWWPDRERWSFKNGALIDADCVGWYPLPGEEAIP